MIPIRCDICGNRYADRTYHVFRAAIEDGEGHDHHGPFNGQDAVGEITAGIDIYEFEGYLATEDFSVCSLECVETLYRWSPQERKAKIQHGTVQDYAAHKEYAREFYSELYADEGGYP